MEAYYSDAVMRGLKQAQKKAEKKKNRLRVHVGDDVYPVMKYWGHGFSVDQEDVPNLRGLIDIFDGARHLSQCLIIGEQSQDGVTHYEFKRKTQVRDAVPLDYERDENAPIALLE